MDDLKQKELVIDWEKIELDYRAGVKTLRQIAEEHSITHGAVNKRAKRDNWTRDLSAKIKAKAQELVSKAAVSKTVSKEQKLAEKEIIEVNAQMQANIIVEHRQDIQRNRGLAKRLLAEIEFATDNIELFEQLGELLIDTSDDKNQAAYKRQEALNKVLSTSSRIDSAKKLSETLKTLIGLEREAFGIDQRANLGDTLEDMLEKLDKL